MQPYLEFGELDLATKNSLSAVLSEAVGMRVRRVTAARSSTPFPHSTDLEQAITPLLERRGFRHHVRLVHPDTGDAFVYDFWREEDRVAIEITGYRADDEIYKDILKFHVHEGTRVGVVWVPRWKWVSGRRTETNFRAAIKALAFAEKHVKVQALVAVVYDWEARDSGNEWSLRFVAQSGPGYPVRPDTSNQRP